jgi:hypothetical protein
MKKLRILPAAAGIIALTATIGFENYSRSSITLVQTRSRIAPTDAVPDSRLVEIKPDSTAYLVEVRHGELFAEVLIDAATGRILLAQAFPPARAAA